MLELLGALVLAIAMAVDTAVKKSAPRALTKDELKWVRGWSRDNDPDVDPDMLTWSFQEDYPTLRFLGLMSLEDWREWQLMERDVDEEVGRPGYNEALTQAMASGDVVEPVVLIEREDGTLEGIWDGWHRAAAALMAQRSTVRAYVGRRTDQQRPLHQAIGTTQDGFQLLVLPAGLKLYHGTATSEPWETEEGPAAPLWLSESPEVAHRFTRWNVSSGADDESVRLRVLTYALTRPISLVRLKSLDEMNAWVEHLGLDPECWGSQEAAYATCDAGVDGWIVVDNYGPGQSDILLCDVTALHLVEAKLLPQRR